MALITTLLVLRWFDLRHSWRVLSGLQPLFFSERPGIVVFRRWRVFLIRHVTPLCWIEIFKICSSGRFGFIVQLTIRWYRCAYVLFQRPLLGCTDIEPSFINFCSCQLSFGDSMQSEEHTSELQSR